ncbi:MAG: FAD-dependent oxidoreductase [Methylococcales bacterium]|nr:FAD-dependent oxidoreductase [Methylococcales bacterium]
MNTDVLIIGGGLIGSSIALQLALRGTRVIVIEKESSGRHASGVNAGGLRQLNRDVAEIPLTVEAAKLWRNIEELVDSDCDTCFPGQIRVAENDADLKKLQQRQALVASLGYQHEEMISKDELYDYVPALSPHCVGALVCREDGYARPYHALTAFRHKAESLGVHYSTDNEVYRLDKFNGIWRVRSQKGEFEAPVIINCAGAWANQFAASLGEAVPLTPQTPMMMVTERLPAFINPVVGAASRKLSFKQMQNGTLVIGGVHLAKLNFQKQSTEMDWNKLSESAKTVMALFPQLEKVRIVRAWAGLEGFMPDNLPIISASSTEEGIYHAFGFSAHGFQLSPIIGKIMAQLILDGKSDLPVDAFAITRFNEHL